MRNEFSAKTREAAHKRSGGLCELHLILGHCGSDVGTRVCISKLGEGTTFYEHINPDYNSKDNSLQNCACLCRACWRWKTRTYDLPLIAKTKRQHRRAIGIKKPSTFRGWRNFRGEIVRAK